MRLAASISLHPTRTFHGHLYPLIGYAKRRLATIRSQPIFRQQIQVEPAKGHHNKFTPLDSFVLAAFRHLRRQSIHADVAFCPLPKLVQQYDSRAGKIIDAFLPYESTPDASRRVDFGGVDDGVVLIAHVIDDGDKHKLSICSGFVINTRGSIEGTVVASCAHTLEEIRRSSLLLSPSAKSGNLLLYTIQPPVEALRTLPVNPYPIPVETRIRARFLSTDDPSKPGWHQRGPHAWKKWTPGHVVSYRDLAGREAHPGTYDTLSHMLYSQIPSPGSSGAPIVDETSGSVVGIVTGSRMNSHVEGLRGWGTPAEALFELFQLPGLSTLR
ncbi:hypothetical protein BOTBODRAFT_379435 [Botryobasidium botryosum FD-172 SS1]|uniref:Serine protease n=1 Tax=Botryobasidium botryosum (strain FD-172 SS1) TaxID=930990 RepID=A0A067MVU8_BOTB1|nr:hypothetical protein BOTBODRAFT_379435 [Botryobasidium botryosum FD-172 SS1]